MGPGGRQHPVPVPPRSSPPSWGALALAGSRAPLLRVAALVSPPAQPPHPDRHRSYGDASARWARPLSAVVSSSPSATCWGRGRDAEPAGPGSGRDRTAAMAGGRPGLWDSSCCSLERGTPEPEPGHARAHAHTRTHTHAHTQVHAHAHTHGHTHTYTHTHVHGHTQTHTHARTHAHGHTRAHLCGPRVLGGDAAALPGPAQHPGPAPGEAAAGAQGRALLSWEPDAHWGQARRGGGGHPPHRRCC